jgi:hypothetical protein
MSPSFKFLKRSRSRDHSANVAHARNTKNTAKPPPQPLDRLKSDALKARNENWARTRAALTPGSARRSSWPLSLGKCTDYNFRSERKGEQVCVRHRATCWITEVTSCLSQTGAVQVTRCLRGRSSTSAHSCDAGPRRRWVQSSMPHMRITSMAADLQDGRANTARPVRCVA